jgi:hypothetical protein
MWQNAPSFAKKVLKYNKIYQILPKPKFSKIYQIKTKVT